MSTNERRMKSAWYGGREDLRRLLEVIDDSFENHRQEVVSHKTEAYVEIVATWEKMQADSTDQDRYGDRVEESKIHLTEEQEAAIRSTQPSIAVNFADDRSFSDRGSPAELVQDLPSLKVKSLTISSSTRTKRDHHSVSVEMSNLVVDVTVASSSYDWVAATIDRIGVELRSKRQWWQKIPIGLWFVIAGLALLSLLLLIYNVSPVSTALPPGTLPVVSFVLTLALLWPLPRILPRFYLDLTGKKSTAAQAFALLGGLLVGVVGNVIYALVAP